MLTWFVDQVRAVFGWDEPWMEPIEERSQLSTAPPPAREIEPLIDTWSIEIAQNFTPTWEGHVERVAALVEVLRHEMAGRRMDPPSVPALAKRILDLVGRGDVEISKLARLIEHDQAIASRLLRLGSSVHFVNRNQILSVHDAIVRLGTAQAANVAVALASRSLFDNRAQLDEHLPRWNRLFEHGMITAFGAVDVAQSRTRRHSEQAFLGGLFHDVGKTVGLRALIDLARDGRRPLDPPAVIDDALHRLHEDTDTGLYESWGLPEPLVDICRLHHAEPSDATNNDLECVRLISGIDSIYHGSPLEKQSGLDEVQIALTRLRMRDAELRATATKAKEWTGRVRAMLQ